MEVLGTGIIARFQKRHANSRTPLNDWLAKTKAAQWSSFTEIRRTFDSVDYVKGLYVFNVGGNNFRVIAIVKFIEKRVIIEQVMTHPEYNNWKPK